MLVRLYRGTSLHAEISGELPRGWEARAGRQPPVEDTLTDVAVNLPVQRLAGLLIDRDGKDASAARARRHRVAPKRDTRKWYGGHQTG